MNQALIFTKSIAPEELKFISEADYGQDSEQHLQALEKLIFEQDCVVNQKQYWFPYEVVELCCWRCKEGHEREFAICNIIMALSIIAGADGSNNPKHLLDTIGPEYDKLPVPLRELVVNLLIEASDKCR